MPLWRIFAHPSTFTPAQRLALSKDVTALYVSRDLPAFYVNVVFIDTPESTVYVGGEEKHNFVRIVIEQIARTLPDPGTEAGKKYRRMWMDMINDTLKPHIIDRPELDWEHHIYGKQFQFVVEAEPVGESGAVTKLLIDVFSREAV